MECEFGDTRADGIEGYVVFGLPQCFFCESEEQRRFFLFAALWRDLPGLRMLMDVCAALERHLGSYSQHRGVPFQIDTNSSVLVEIRLPMLVFLVPS